MRSYRLRLDRATGDIVALGIDGRVYTITELERAEEGAARGDAAALEVIRQVELTAAAVLGDQAGA